MARKRGCNEIEPEESFFFFMTQRKFWDNQRGFQPLNRYARRRENESANHFVKGKAKRKVTVL